MHQKRYLLALLIIALLSTTMISAVKPQTAGEPETLTLKLSDLGYTKDETLVGIHVDRSYGVLWPEAWKPEKGNNINISFSHSKALDASSSLVVDWNGIRLGSTQIDSSTADRGSLSVEIPEELIQPGYNEIRLEFYMGIHTDDFCQDISNPNIWATIHSDSAVSFLYTKKPAELSLNRFPYPFVDSSDLIENTVTLIVPEQPTEAELNAVAIVSAKLGQEASYRILNLDAAAAESADKVSGNVIYIGLADRLPVLKSWDVPFAAKEGNKVRLVDSNQKALPEGTGVLWEQALPGDESSTALVVTGANDAALIKAASGLASETAYPRINGPLGLILDVPAPVVGQGPAGQVLTFKGLGYEDVNARGIREQTLNFIIPVSLAWQIQSEIVLDLHFAHSTLLDGQRSALNLSLNGSPVSNILLTADNAEDAWATFRLPARMFKIGDNRLTINSTINLSEGYTDTPEGECGENFEEEAWAAVYSDSRVTLPPAPAGMSLTLADYPMAYVGDPSLAQLAFIVPDQAGLTTARVIAQIASRLGRYANGTTLAPTVQTAQKALASASSKPYQILVGLPTTNAAIQKVNASLPLPFQPKSNQINASGKLPEVASNNGSTGYLEVVQDEQGNPCLIVAGTNAESLLWAAGAVSQPELMGSLKGDVAILDSSKTMVTAQVREPKPAEVVLGASTTVVEQAKPVPWVLWAAYIFLGLTVLVFIILWVSETIRRRHMKENYEIHS